MFCQCRCLAVVVDDVVVYLLGEGVDWAGNIKLFFFTYYLLPRFGFVANRHLVPTSPCLAFGNPFSPASLLHEAQCFPTSNGEFYIRLHPRHLWPFVFPVSGSVWPCMRKGQLNGERVRGRQRGTPRQSVIKSFGQLANQGTNHSRFRSPRAPTQGSSRKAAALHLLSCLPRAPLYTPVLYGAELFFV
jgi:hypothetical protein